MYVTNTDGVKKLDRKAIEEWNIPSAVLMENAGRSAMEIIKRELGDLPETAVVICGKGNNGGDGLVIARRLLDSGVSVRTFVLGDLDSLSPESARNAAILERMTEEVFYCGSGSGELADELRETPPLIIDAIFGIGIRGPLRGDYPRLISLINSTRSRVISVDIPSGLPGDTGSPEGEAVKADITTTMSPVKVGTLRPEAFGYVGRQFVASVDYPEGMFKEDEDIWRLLDDEFCSCRLPKRNSAGHKGDFGKLLITGGSTGMLGAPLLAGKSALRSGTGLVYVAVPQELNSISSSGLIEALNLGLPSEGGHLVEGALDCLLEETQGKEAVAIGPGIGRAESTARLVREYLHKINIPIVLDADGIWAFRDNLDELKSIQNLVLTPHPGELSRLLDISPQKIDKKRFEIAPRFAREYELTLLLKGVPTVISSSTGNTSVASCPNSGLAKGGSGDVLTGLIGSFLSQGLQPYTASRIGSWLHCRLGEKGAAEFGVDSLQPGNLVEFVGSILTEWRKE